MHTFAYIFTSTNLTLFCGLSKNSRGLTADESRLQTLFKMTISGIELNTHADLHH